MSIDSASLSRDPRPGDPPNDDAISAPPLDGQEVHVHEKLLLAIMTIALFVFVGNIYMMAPLLVDLSLQFNTSVGAMGQLAAAASIPWAIFGPFMGMLSDRFGRRNVLAAGSLILGATTLLSATAWSYSSLFLFRMVGGIAGATSGPVITAAVADFFPPSRRGQAIGITLSGVSLASIVGVPLVALVASYTRWQWAFVGAGSLLILISVAVWFTFPGVKPARTSTGYVAGLVGALRERSSPPLLIGNALDRSDVQAAMTYLPAFLMQAYGMSLGQIAPILSAAALTTLVGSVLGGRLADRGRQAQLYVAVELISACLVVSIFAFTPGVLITALVVAVFGLINSTGRPAWMWMISQVPPERRGATLGFMATSNQTGIVVGAAVGGMLVGQGTFGLVGVLGAVCAIGAAIGCTMGASRMGVARRATDGYAHP